MRREIRDMSLDHQNYDSDNDDNISLPTSIANSEKRQRDQFYNIQIDKLYNVNNVKKNHDIIGVPGLVQSQKEELEKKKVSETPY